MCEEIYNIEICFKENVVFNMKIKVRNVCSMIVIINLLLLWYFCIGWLD